MKTSILRDDLESEATCFNWFEFIDSEICGIKCVLFVQFDLKKLFYASIQDVFIMFTNIKFVYSKFY